AKTDLAYAEKMVQLYSQSQPSAACVTALKQVICAYHFPLCTNDDKEFTQICYDSCAAMHASCNNVTLPYFASIGSRCNFLSVYSAGAPVSQQAYITANSQCTAVGKSVLAGCFSVDGSVLRQVEEAAEGAGSEGVRAERIRIKDVKPRGTGILSHDNRRNKTRFARVVFVFEHETARQTSIVTARTSQGQALQLQLSRKHVLPVLASSGNVTTPDVKHMFADELKEGDVVCISPVASKSELRTLRVDLTTPLHACQHTAKIVTVQNRTQRVKYVVADSDYLYVDEVFVTTYRHPLLLHGDQTSDAVSQLVSWPSGDDPLPVACKSLDDLDELLTTSYSLLDWLSPDILQHASVQHALGIVLESPLLESFEDAINGLRIEETAKVLGEPDSVAGAGAIQADAAASSQLLSQLKVQQRPRGYKVMCFCDARDEP
ncbi:hypothetical protein GUITHDRAFT_149673, partial [Guillardia theta CCMP2712]